jgi:polyhydroxybutyrate depolymerase
MAQAPGLAEAAGSLSAGDYEQHLAHGGRERWYSVHIPTGHVGDGRAPLVFNFHGGMGNPTQQRHDSNLDEVSDREGFVVVYPAGTGMFPRRGLTFNAGVCCGYAKNNNIDDVGFAEAVLADVARFVKFDPARVYATGFSNGGFLCYRIACERPKLFRAIAVVSAVQGISLENPAGGEPVPLLHMHGLQDQNVSFRGGVGANAMEKVARASVPETIDFWLVRNGCSRDDFQETRKGAAVCRRYRPREGGKPVVFWTVEDGGHTWPGGRSSLPESMVGAINQDIQASDVIWDFFNRG